MRGFFKNQGFLSIMKVIIITVFLLTFSSCKKEKDIIEIYLTKKRIESYDGIAVKEAIKDSVMLKDILHNYGEKVRVDTINNKLIYMGNFNATHQDLEETPFIKDSEILGMDFKESAIHFKSSVADKIYGQISKWKNPQHTGRQFVLCKNGKIILNGYLLGSMSSYWSNTYSILYYPKESNKGVVKYSIYDSLNLDPEYLKNDKQLRLAFKNRILK